MGYSTPKKQLDLKEFLSTPAKNKPFVRKFATTKPKAEVAATDTSDDTAS